LWQKPNQGTDNHLIKYLIAKKSSSIQNVVQWNPLFSLLFFFSWPIQLIAPNLQQAETKSKSSIDKVGLQITYVSYFSR